MKDLCIIMLQAVATTIAANYRNVLVNMFHSATEMEENFTKADQHATTRDTAPLMCPPMEVKPPSRTMLH